MNQLKKPLRRASERQLVVEPRVWSERQRAYKDPSGDKVVYYFLDFPWDSFDWDIGQSELTRTQVETR